MIVEIEPWLGVSTWYLAAGMESSGHKTDKCLLVYVNFIWCEFMSERAQLTNGAKGTWMYMIVARNQK